MLACAAMPRVLGLSIVLFGSIAAASPKLPAEVPVPPHTRVLSVEDGKPIHAAYTWKAMLAVDCKAKPIVDERAKLDKELTVKSTAADAALVLFFERLRADKKAATMMPPPDRQVSLELPGHQVLFAGVSEKTDGCGPELELSVGPAGG